MENQDPSSEEDRDVERDCLRCAEVMSCELILLETAETVASAARKMRDANVGFLPVCSPDQRLLGVLTDRDLTLRVLAEGRPPETAVHEVMTAELVACSADAEVDVAEGLMRAYQKGRIPCIDTEGRVVGVISLADIARYTSAEEAGDLLGELAGREVR